MRSLLFICFVTVLIGCVKLPIHRSSWGQPVAHPEFPSGYDLKSQIRWYAYNDEEFLYFHFDVAKDLTARQIFMDGLKLYFDTLNRKNTTQYLNYPTERPLIEVETGGRDRDMPKEVIFRGVDGLISFQKGLDQAAVSVDMKVVDRILNYEAKIPLKMLGIGPHTKQISIGMVTATRDVEITPNDNPMGNTNGMPQQGNRTMGGGRLGAGMPAGATNRNIGPDALNYWFSLTLAEKP